MAGPQVRLPLGRGCPQAHQGPDAGRRALPRLADLHLHRAQQPRPRGRPLPRRPRRPLPRRDQEPPWYGQERRLHLDLPWRRPDAHDREPAALHRQQVEGPQEPAHPGRPRDSPQALHPSHRASRLPLRAEPPLRVRPVPARTRLRPGRTRRADHAPRHLARLPQPAAPQRQRPRNPHLLQAAAEADAQAGLAAPAQERQGRPVRARPPRLRRRARPGRTTSPRTPPCPATSPAASGSTCPS